MICFCVGNKSESIISRIKKVLDNYDFYTYNSIQEIIKDANLRHLAFKRIIISDSIITNATEDLDELNTFIKNYSSNTEVVLLVTGRCPNSTECEKHFNEVFNSPMFTPVKPEKFSMRVFENLISKDIAELEYSFYADAKNSTENQDSSLSNVNTSNDLDTGTKERLINSEEKVLENSEMDGINSSSFTSNENSISNNDDTNFSSFDDGRVSVGVNDFDDEFSTEDDEDLSLGDFGSMHSDTGFLDVAEEEEDEELQNFKKLQENSPEVVAKEPKEITISTPKKEVIEDSVVTSQENSVNSTNIDIILSLRDANNTQDIVDSAVKMVTEDNASILLIDADVRANRLLSFIDVERFYQRGCNQGISKMSIYTEDGVGVLSNGYGSTIQEKDVSMLLSNNIIRSYDMVYIDCPIDCLSIIPTSILKSCNIILNPGNTLTDFISTSLMLSNREYTSFEKESIINSKCLLDLENYSNEDISLVKDLCLFTNGSWIDRIGL